jgi:hypothetical protein
MTGLGTRSLIEPMKQLGALVVGKPAAGSSELFGEIWHLRIHGESADFPRKGNQSLTWLHKLLAAPHKLFTVAELQGDPSGKLAADAGIGMERQMDDTGIKQIKCRLEEIEGITEGTGGSESMEHGKAALLQQLQEALRGKKLDSPLKDAHRNIAVQIRALREKKLAKDMPALAAHALKLDFPYVGYYPSPGTPAWQV